MSCNFMKIRLSYTIWDTLVHVFVSLYIAAIIKYSVQLIIKFNHILLNLCESHVARSLHALITKPKLIISRTV